MGYLLSQMSKASEFLKHVGEGAAAYEIHKDIMGGLPFRIIATVAEQAGLAPEDLGRRIGVSRSTFHRRKKAAGSRLSTQESDALARYASLTARAVETFDGDEDAARSWLGSPQPGLGDVVPLEMAQTTPGYREVEKLLTRIDHGVYA
jgi:putative toxin-antitoxin system antitoxin component (TIGR02293 family)